MCDPEIKIEITAMCNIVKGMEKKEDWDSCCPFFDRQR